MEIDEEARERLLRELDDREDALDLRALLVNAEAALRDAADGGGASGTYRAAANALELVIFTLDQEARDAI